MKILIGSDHAGFEYKTQIITQLNSKFDIQDCGTNNNNSCDYADYAHAVASKVSKTSDGRGILICGSANGVCMTANKHKNIRAALVWQEEIARLARQHNDANIICIPARFISLQLTLQCIDIFLSTPFEGGRHLNRVQKIDL